MFFSYNKKRKKNLSNENGKSIFSKAKNPKNNSPSAPSPAVLLLPRCLPRSFCSGPAAAWHPHPSVLERTLSFRLGDLDFLTLSLINCVMGAKYLDFLAWVSLSLKIEGVDTPELATPQCFCKKLMTSCLRNTLKIIEHGTGCCCSSSDDLGQMEAGVRICTSSFCFPVWIRNRQNCCRKWPWRLSSLRGCPPIGIGFSYKLSKK